MSDSAISHRKFVDACRGLPPMRTAVCHPCSDVALEGAMEAAEAGLIIPVLVGPPATIRSVAESAGISLGDAEIVATEHSHQSAERAVELCRTGDCGVLMKGSLHTDELMHEVARTGSGLRTERRISHIFVMQTSHYPKPLLITDAAINIEPDLDDKADIVQNAIDLAHVLGTPEPLVAILSAVETVYPKIRSTIDAAALCKMADRGQITGGILDGPLAFDNAINEEAAQIKGIKSPVAGHADILVVPDLESGNMLAKQLHYLGGALAAGLVMGARVPIVLTSRADDAATRLASCAIGVLVAASTKRFLGRKQGDPAETPAQ